MLSKLLTLGMLCAAGQAAVLTVGQANTPCPGAQYNTIGAAVAAASAGDTIHICPALYPEQLIITKPLSLIGVSVSGPAATAAGSYRINRVLLQPVLTDLQNFTHEAVITVMNTNGVTIQNLAIDASNNSVSGCGITLAGIHFLNSSGAVRGSAISGAQLASPQTCATVFGNGFGVLVNTDGALPGPFDVAIDGNSIHDYTKDGVYIVGPGANVSTAPLSVKVRDNAISGVGPASGALQFGVFVFGALAQITGNRIGEGTCGAIAVGPDCVNLRSEGVTLRVAEAGTVVEGNVIMNAQSGIFVNGGTGLTIALNVISGIEGLDGIDIQATTNSLFDGNIISNVFPISSFGCGIWEAPNTGLSGNRILNTTVNDAYCGVGFVTADRVSRGSYSNTLYNEVNGDLYPNPLPPVEPGQPGGAAATSAILRVLP